MRPPEPDPLPLRVDVINGWPISNELKLLVSTRQQDLGYQTLLLTFKNMFSTTTRQTDRQTAFKSLILAVVDRHSRNSSGCQY